VKCLAKCPTFGSSGRDSFPRFQQLPPSHPLPAPSRIPLTPFPQHLRLDKFPETFRIAVIADLDQRSKKENGKQWSTTYMTGTLRRKGESYDIKWDSPTEMATSHNEAGRGCELSELVKYNDVLYTFDDRTGIMFEVKRPDRSDAVPAPYLVPRHIFMEGGGEINDKGLKLEWATVKDGLLYAGSFGKEFTNSAGEIVHTNNLWAVTYAKDGSITHHDWKGNYDRLRTALGYEYPGYLLHETIVWSPHTRKWFVLPRRVSKETYEEEKDEKMGSNILIIASHDFSDITWKTVGVSQGNRRKAQWGWGRG
jgi:soluble calcium-activated nucleotidase 1